MNSVHRYTYFFITLALYHAPLYSMDIHRLLSTVQGFFDPTLPEAQRSSVGSLLRATLKRIGTSDMDLNLAGLNNEAEKRTTLTILEKVRNHPEDVILQKQFLDRQGAVNRIAFNLITALKQFNIKPSTADVSETLGSIRISMDLRTLHAQKILSPLLASQLLEETNAARNNITKTLGVQTHDNSGLLPLEPELDDETMKKAIHILKQDGFKIFGTTEHEEQRLIQAAHTLCKSKKEKEKKEQPKKIGEEEEQPKE